MFKSKGCCIAVFALFNQCTRSGKQEHTSNRLIVPTFNILQGGHDAGKANEKVVLVGDFNEPSHLDWTRRFSSQGMDRWVTNPTETPLRFAVEWSGSKALEDIGLSDAYRTVHTDEVAKPGNTWTPPYPTGTPGRQDYHNQVLDRIDRIYFTRSGLTCKRAALVTDSKGADEVKLNTDWRSDHWAILAEFELI